MAATQLVSGHGGWPMSVFLAARRTTLHGRYVLSPGRTGRSGGLRRALDRDAEAWTTRRDAVERQADELARALEREVRFVDHLAPFTDTARSRGVATTTARRPGRARRRRRWLRRRPEVPASELRRGAARVRRRRRRATRSNELSTRCRDAGSTTTSRGGFARYSVDGEWHVPHFEKMLSDQALLARATFARRGPCPSVPSGARSPSTRSTSSWTTSPSSGGFASALDADAGGVEGSHVTWTTDEVAAALQRRERRSGPGGDAATMAHRRRRDRSRVDRSLASPTANPSPRPTRSRPCATSLRAARARRAQPRRDEKIILEWNAMLASALLEVRESTFTEAGHVTPERSAPVALPRRRVVAHR